MREVKRLYLLYELSSVDAALLQELSYMDFGFTGEEGPGPANTEGCAFFGQDAEGECSWFSEFDFAEGQIAVCGDDSKVFQKVEHAVLGIRTPWTHHIPSMEFLGVEPWPPTDEDGSHWLSHR